MSVPVYERYRDSGVEWLGEVPSHWDVAPIKAGFSVLGGSTPKSDVSHFWDGDVPWITPADLSRVTGLKIGSSMRMITEEGVASCGTTKAPAGSVVLSTRAPIGSIAVTTVAACTNQGCKTMVPKGQLASNLLAFALSVATEQLNIRGRGTTFLELSADELGGFKVPVPPTGEQAAIAAFLDRETAKIDALVEEQRRLIDLLKEKRQAVISHAVTKGLDPSVPMKDSGVEWLGEVPAHWEAGPLKRYWSVTDCKHLTADFIEEGVPLASIREVQARFVDLSGAKQTTEAFFSQMIEGGRRPEAGDLIFSRNATVGEVAEVAGWHPQFAMGQDVCLLKRQDLKLSSAYLYHTLRSEVVGEQLALAMIGSTFKRVNVEDIRNLKVPAPPVRDQEEIAEYVEALSESFEALAAEASAAIALLQERRSALISAAVTGKIDVRGLVPNPDQIEAA